MADIKIATVAPIGEGVFVDSLTYFTLRDIKPGSLIFVPLRKKKMPAILLSMKPVKDVRSEIKNSGFELKKIESATNQEIFSKEFMAAAEKTSDYFGASLGQVLNCFLPSNLVKSIEKNLHPKKIHFGPNPKEENKKNEKKKITEVVQSPEEDRLAFYKSLIREEFARKSSIFLCLPTIHEIGTFSESLKRGIEEYTIIMRPEDSPKKMAQNWAKIIENSHPMLVIATPIFLSLLNDNFNTIILEKESSPAYKNISRPYIDSRFFIEEIANKMSMKLIIGDTVLRMETIHKKENETYPASLLFKYRLLGKARSEVINMKEERTNEVKAVGGSLLKLIEESIESKKNILLLSARRGLANITVCRDCRSIVLCKKCGGGVTLHKGESINIFSCHKCGTYSETSVLCAKCRSWNLKTLGFGTEKIEEEVRSEFGQAKIFRLDGDMVKTYRQGRQIMNEFLQEKGSILIGTEMALFYLMRPIENVAIVSVDAMFSIPDHKMRERLFNYLINAKLSAENNFLIQTRVKDNPIFEKVIRGDTLQFYREEIVARKNYDYSPFKIPIKITSEGKRDDIEKEFDELANFLKKWSPDIYKSSNLKNGRSRMNILIKTNPCKWPDKRPEGSEFNEEDMTLIEILKSLPPRFMVRVDPESIL